MNLHKVMLGIGIVLLLVIPIWIFFIAPELLKMPGDYKYKAEIISIDNFFDEKRGEYSGEQVSRTSFFYESESSENNVLIIKNVFDVRTITGEKIFSVQRTYGVNRYTGKHVKGYGDKDRTGYLFAPRKIKKQDFAYWHINYNEPATMKFQDEEIINGLEVYRYEVDYNADPTELLTHLPGVPEEKGVGNDINLQLWIEPVSGKLIKYEDKTLAYYYDINTKERLDPWNKFGNKYSEDSIATQVRLAQNEKQRIYLLERIVPILLGLVGIALIFASFIGRRLIERDEKKPIIKPIIPKKKEILKKREKDEFT